MRYSVRFIALCLVVSGLIASCSKKSTPAPPPQPTTREINVKFLVQNQNLSSFWKVTALYLQTDPGDTTVAKMTLVPLDAYYKSALPYLGINFLGDGNAGNSSIITETAGGTWGLDASGTVLSVTPKDQPKEVSDIRVNSAGMSFGSYTKFDTPVTF